MTSFTVQVANAPSMYIQGLQYSNNTVSPNTLINVSAGVCRDQTNTFDMNLGNFQGLNSQNAAQNVVTVIDSNVIGVNGLDKGPLVIGSFYSIFVISDTQTSNTTACLISLANGYDTFPLMPYGYDAYRLIGYIATDSSRNFIPISLSAGALSSGDSSKRTLTYLNPQVTNITAGTSVGFANISMSGLVPTKAGSIIAAQTIFTPAAANDKLFLQSTLNSTSYTTVQINGQVAGVALYNQVSLPALVDGAAVMQYRVTAGTVAINVSGFSFSV